jgi:predicted DNA-binding protein
VACPIGLRTRRAPEASDDRLQCLSYPVLAADRRPETLVMDSNTIQLDRNLAERLVRLARATDRSPGDVVRDAVDEYLMRHEVDDAEWQTRVTAVVARLRSGVPVDEAPEAIEREITAAREEMRASRTTGGR